MEDHPLSCKWTIYCEQGRKAVSKESYESQVTKLGSFGTIVEFWSYWRALPQPQALPIGSNLRIFRSGVSPSWEDPQNADGGKVSLMISRDKTVEPWRNVVLEIIGESLESAHTVTGMVLSIRERENYIHVWNRDNKAVKDVATLTAELLNAVGDCLKSSYTSHLRDASGIAISKRGTRGGGGRRRSSVNNNNGSSSVAGSSVFSNNSPCPSPSVASVDGSTMMMTAGGGDSYSCYSNCSSPVPSSSRQNSSTLFDSMSFTPKCSSTSAASPCPGAEMISSSSYNGNGTSTKGFLLPTPALTLAAAPPSRAFFVSRNSNGNGVDSNGFQRGRSLSTNSASSISSATNVAATASNGSETPTAAASAERLALVRGRSVEEGEDEEKNLNNNNIADDNDDENDDENDESIGSSVATPQLGAGMKKGRPRGCRGRGLTKTVKSVVVNILPPVCGQKRLGNPPPEVIFSALTAEMLGVALVDPIHSRAPTPAGSPPEMDSGSDSERPVAAAAAAAAAASTSSSTWSSLLAARNAAAHDGFSSEDEVDECTIGLLTSTTNMSYHDQSSEDEATEGPRRARSFSANKIEEEEGTFQAEAAPVAVAAPVVAVVAEEIPAVAAAAVATPSSPSKKEEILSPAPSAASSSSSSSRKLGNVVATKLRDLKEKMTLRKSSSRKKLDEENANSNNNNNGAVNPRLSGQSTCSESSEGSSNAPAAGEEGEQAFIAASSSPIVVVSDSQQEAEGDSVVLSEEEKQRLAAKEKKLLQDVDDENEHDADNDGEGEDDEDDSSDEEEEDSDDDEDDEDDENAEGQEQGEYIDEITTLKRERRRKKSWKTAITAVAGASATTLMVWGAFVLHEVGVANVQL